MEAQKITFPSRSENIALVEKLVNDVCQNYKVTEDHYGNILVAVTEAAINAIYHGNKSNPEKKVDVTFKSENDLILFSVTDEGEGFDFSNLPDPTAPENIEKP